MLLLLKKCSVIVISAFAMQSSFHTLYVGSDFLNQRDHFKKGFFSKESFELQEQ